MTAYRHNEPHLRYRWKGWEATTDSLLSAGWMVDNYTDPIRRYVNHRVGLRAKRERMETPYKYRGIPEEGTLLPTLEQDTSHKDSVYFSISISDAVIEDYIDFRPPVGVDLEDLLLRHHRVHHTPVVVSQESSEFELLQKILDRQGPREEERLRDMVNQTAPVSKFELLVA